MNCRLRVVTAKDRDLIFLWANDAMVRKNSFNIAPIAYDSHCAWFEKRLNSANTAFYILEDNNIPVGQIRYDIEDTIATVNYSIAQEYRGNGYGIKIIELGEVLVREALPSVKKIVARVKKENQVSRMIFKRLQYIEKVEEGEYLFERILL